MQTQRNPISGHVRLRRGKRGDTWYAKYRGPRRQSDTGRIVTVQTEEKIGPAWSGNGRRPDGYYTKKTAKDWLDKKLSDLRGDVGIPTEGSASFGEAAATWYRLGLSEKDWKPSTRRDYRSVLKTHLGVEVDETGALIAAREPFGDLPLAEITTQVIRHWRANAMAEGRLPRRTATKVVAIMHAIFQRAQEQYALTTNPAANVTPLSNGYDASRFDFYSVEEVMALVRAAENTQDAAIFLTAACTGLRRGELLALRVRDVDFPNETIRVMQSVDPVAGIGTTKSGNGRSVPMVPEVAQTLARILQRDDFTGADDLVFPNVEGRWLDGSALRRRYIAAQKRAGLRPLRFHDLRHTFGTHGRARAESDRELQEWLGHADARTTARYTHYRPRKDAARRLASAFAVEQPADADGEAVPANDAR